MTSRENRWLMRACRDHRLPPYSFRVAFSVLRMASNGKLRTTTEQLMHFSGAKSSATLLHSVDRLAACRYVDVDREYRGGPLLISILHVDDRSAGSAT